MSEELTPPRFPTMLRKMWSGGEVQAWIDENWNRRAQPAAPADDAPSVAPEPDAYLLDGMAYMPADLDREAIDASIPLFAHPPRAPLTPDILLTHRSCYSESEWAVFVGGVRFAEMEHGIGGK